MTRHLLKEIERLKKTILELCALVEEQVFKAVKAVSERDVELAETVIGDDRKLDIMEVEIEEECLKILALHQPVAIDLRFIIAVLKINNDLERIGDLAVNIAERAKFLAMLPPAVTAFNFEDMATKVKSMLKKSVDALVNMDPKLAKEVCKSDDEVDEINRQMYRIVHEGVRREPQHAENFILLHSVSRNLERIADHSTNIAEDIMYMIDGQIVRHGRQ